MKKAGVIAIVIGSVFTVIGAVLLGLGIANERVNRELVTHTYEIKDSVNVFDINISTADLYFKKDEENPRVVVKEREKEYHEVSVNDETLSIKFVNELKWYENIFDFSVGKMEIEIYLPEQEYKELKIISSTGDIEVNKDYSFETVDISLSTGNLKLYSSVSSELKISSSTGDIIVNDVDISKGYFKASTGNISLEKVNALEDIKVETSTGRITLNEVEAASLTTSCSTGRVNVSNSLFTKEMNIKTSTGDIRIVDSDAGGATLIATTGDVNATFLTSKIVFATSKSGDINVPRSTEGGRVDVETTTGDIYVSFKE